ncbi:MAG: Flp family type IVb pilin [Firmicutes bacterium HGW-Firmicutes-8]|nr:MAG: Flp family type IVb pilin [Firmicutes bacterium HGW-Firmicutes-8]
MKLLLELLVGNKGQGLTEYGLILAVFVITVICGVMLVGPKVSALFANTSAQIN